MEKKKKIRPLPLRRISITDELFSSYVNLVYERMIPYQWSVLNDKQEDAAPTYCIENFRIAAGCAEGKRKGVVFQDTDLYKWLETVAYVLASGHGSEWEKVADEVIELIAKAQESDGYLNTYFTVNAPERKWKNLTEGHELYTAGHMIEAAVAYYDATGKKKFLEVAEKNADLICRIFGSGDGQCKGYPGHQEVELALVKLYRATGKKEYLETAKFFIDARGKEPNYIQDEIEKRGGFEFFPELSNYDLEYAQTDVPPVQQKKPEGHAVRQMYQCSAMADLAEEYGDAELREACESIWTNMVRRQMYITGGIGSSGFRERFTTDYDLPNNTNYCETCASVGLMMFGQRMAALTGEAGYYHTVERALYNTVLAGVNIAGNRYFYVNPLEVVPEFCTSHTYMHHVKPTRQKWFDVACCPANAARTLASLGQYIYAVSEDGLRINQYISSEIAPEDGFGLRMSSGLLQDGKIQINVQTEKALRLWLRIPEYTKTFTVDLDGEEVNQEKEQGYFPVDLKEGEHVLEILMQVKPRWMAAYRRVSADSGKAALMKGPMVYCLEEKDNGTGLYEVYINEKTSVQEEAPAEGLVGNVPALSYQGRKVFSSLKEEQLYAPLRLESEKIKLKAVPYAMWNNRGEGEMLVWHKVAVPEEG